MKNLCRAACILLCVTALNLHAQDEENDGREASKKFPFKHNFGVALSSVSGSGVFYKFAITPDYHIKAAGFTLSSEIDDSDNGTEKLSLYNIGAELQRTLYSTRTTRFYALGGANMGNVSTSGGYFVDEEYDFIQYGLGIGFEIVTWKHLSFNLDLSYTRSHGETTTVDRNYPENNGTVKTLNTGIGGGIGIGYTF